MKVLVASGFGNGRHISRTIANNAKPAFNRAELLPVTFSDIEKLHVRGQLSEFLVDNEIDTAVTHSAGVLRLIGSTAVGRIIAYNPPLPVSRWDLLKRTVRKTTNMLRDSKELGRRRVAAYLTSAACELMLHPWSNLRPFINGEISRFDSTALPDHVDFVYTADDEYYGFAAAESELPIVQDGRHDEPYFNSDYASYL